MATESATIQDCIHSPTARWAMFIVSMHVCQQTR